MSFLNTRYSDLKPYTPGEQINDKRYIKLNTNESPYELSKKATKYAEAEIAKARLYPDPEHSALTAKIAAYRCEPRSSLSHQRLRQALYLSFRFFHRWKGLLFPISPTALWSMRIFAA